MVFIESFGFEIYQIDLQTWEIAATIGIDCEQICEYIWAHSQIGFPFMVQRTFSHVCMEKEKQMKQVLDFPASAFF